MKKRDSKNTQGEKCMENVEHFFVNDSEACTEFDWKTDSKSVLLDIKHLMKEYYVATFTDDGTALKLSFNNGQSFIISVTECV